MITGDNPLTAAHVAKQVEIVDRQVLILDHREGSEDEAGELLGVFLIRRLLLIHLNCWMQI